MDAELRKDLIVNRWVLISPRRGKRPHDYNSASPSLKQQAASHPGPCAFCYHHENETGPELLAFHHEGCAPNQPCWRVRVVQNKFPAVSTDLTVPAEPENFGEDGYLRTHCLLPGFGSHEVVIETPDHDQVFTSLSVDQIIEILRAYQSRIEALREDERYKYCQIFKNNGNAAGASMVHSHSQIIALPVVPKAAEDEFAGSKDFYEKSGGKCVFCEVIRFDLRTKTLRLIDKSEHFITLAPFAARFPYETWVLPRKHNSNFGAISDDEIRGLAEMLKLTLCKMDKGFDYPPFNFMLQTGPLQDSNLAYYHWYIRIVPHLTSIAGFELGSGCHINPVAPEHAAEFLRDIKLDEAQAGEEEEETPQSNGTSGTSGTHGTDGSTEHEPPTKLIDMADLGKDLETKDEEPRRLVYMADLGKNLEKDEEPRRLIYMADLVKLDHQLPEQTHTADVGGNDLKPTDTLIGMADLWKKDPKAPDRLINMADVGKKDDHIKPPERLINMADSDTGKDDHQPPERLINMADLGKDDHKPPDRLISMADL